jgi:hypothetical protein
MTAQDSTSRTRGAASASASASISSSIRLFQFSPLQYAQLLVPHLISVSILLPIMFKPVRGKPLTRSSYKYLLVILCLLLFSFFYYYFSNSSQYSFHPLAKKHSALQSRRSVLNSKLCSGELNEYSSISIVYSWVNGSEANYQKQRIAAGGKTGGSRDRDSGELRYSLRSLEQHLPWWCGKLYLVSPGAQFPHWLNVNHPRFELVDQNSLLPDPQQWTFNTNAIEPWLYKIPGLSDMFIYMNDDYFFGRSVDPAHLFSEEGGARFFFEANIIKPNFEVDEPQKKIWLASVYNTDHALDSVYGQYRVGPRHFLKHAPFIFYQYAYEEIHRDFKEEIDQTMQHPFRHQEDVTFPLLHHYYVMQKGYKCCDLPFELASVEEMEHDAVLFVLDDDLVKTKNHLQTLTKNKPRFFTLNDKFSSAAIGTEIRNFLEKTFPQPSSFELHHEL